MKKNLILMCNLYLNSKDKTILITSVNSKDVIFLENPTEEEINNTKNLFLEFELNRKKIKKLIK